MKPFYIKCILFALTPVLLLVLPWIVIYPLVWVRDHFSQSRHLVSSSSSNAPSSPSLAPPAASAMPNSFAGSLTAAFVSRWSEAKDLFFSSVMVVLFMLQPSITSQAFALFNCTSLGDEQQATYLLADLSIQCYDSEHLTYVLCVGIPLLLETVCIPALGLVCPLPCFLFSFDHCFCCLVVDVQEFCSFVRA